MIFYITVLLVNILILSIIYIILRRRIDRLTDNGRVTDELARELDTILAEINQATDRNILIIEDKIKELDLIIAKTEQRISLLRKDELKRPEPTELRKTDLTYSHLNRMNTMSALVTPLKVPEKIIEEEIDEKQKVIELYRSGLSASVISASIGLNMGEVELIISLFRQKENKQD
ncbi:MAG: hypothetical protein JEZ04_00335 [Spirochaetales bacterium]|nr:hypothetical protein [Spirochaetales bacterium]